MIVHSVGELPLARDKLLVWKDSAHGLRSVPFGGYESRQDGVLSLLEQADRSHALGCFAPLLVHTEDRPVSTTQDNWRSYAFCTAPGYVDVPVPDFVFTGWPEVGIDDFDETCRSLTAAGEQLSERPVAGWIGSTHTHPVRSVLLRLGEEHPDVLDVQEVQWVRVPSQQRLKTSAGNALSLPDQVARWAALIDVEGAGYSGRLKLLLHSGRPVLVQDRPWREWYWDALVPMEHFIPVQRDLSDLVERARWVREHPIEAAAIGRAGQQLAQRLLTRASAVGEWARILSAAPAEPLPRWASQPLEDALGPVLHRLGVPLPAGE